jgi:hypothetical protein
MNKPGAVNEPLEFEKVSFEDARKSIEGTRTVDETDWTGKRKTGGADPLLAATVAWVESLPAYARPNQLARDFPRVANKLCELWKQPTKCDEYFQQLLIDHRGGRRGFPPGPAMELNALRSHYEAVYPYTHSIWDAVLDKW